MTPITSFGPEGNQWHYHHDTKTYDLTRGREHGFAVTVDHAPQGTSITLSPDTTALVVVDMQNFFLDSTFGSHPGGLAAVERIKPVVAKCREKGIAVDKFLIVLEIRDVFIIDADRPQQLAADI